MIFFEFKRPLSQFALQRDHCLATTTIQKALGASESSIFFNEDPIIDGYLTHLNMDEFWVGRDGAIQAGGTRISSRWGWCQDHPWR
jgi:hypothetical protein